MAHSSARGGCQDVCAGCMSDVTHGVAAGVLIWPYTDQEYRVALHNQGRKKIPIGKYMLDERINLYDIPDREQ